MVTRRIQALGFACMMACAGLAWAGAWIPEEGEGDVTIAYQYSHAERNLLTDGEAFDTGSTDTSTVYLHGSYGLTERIAVYASLPYVQKRFHGSFPHQIVYAPGTFTPTRKSEEDNGNWHGEFQDFLFGVQYQTFWREWAVTPFVAYGYPSNDYEHLGQAAPGANQKVLELGVDAGRPLFGRYYFQLGYAYGFVESFRHIDVDRSTLTVEAGYIASDRLVVRGFLIGRKTHGGLESDELEYLPPFVGGSLSRTREDIQIYFHHDQLMRADYVNGGVSAFYRLTAQTALLASYQGTIWGENTPETSYALTIGFNRSF